MRVSHSNTTDALAFTQTWRTPAIVVYVKRSKFNVYQSRPAAFSDAVFSNDKRRQDIVPVRPGELQPGVLLAIDAEFVSLERAESEVLTDGTQIVLHPSRLALARVCDHDTAKANFVR